MRFKNRISRLQHKFLLKVRDGANLYDELKAQEGVKDSQFTRWMRNPYFEKNLNRMIKESTRRGHVELALSANVARVLLAKDLYGRRLRIEPWILKDEVRQWCKDILAEWRADVRLQAALRPKGKKAKKPRRRRGIELLHPNARGRMEELLAVMEKEKGKG